jgi:hypothetical protein
MNMANMSGLNGIIPGAQARSAGAEKTRRRLATIALLNGWSVTALGGLCFLLSVVWFSVWGLLIGAVAIASGCMELSGRRRVKQGRPEAGRWLAGSQLLLLGAIFIYAGAQLLWLKPQTVLSDIPAEYREALAPLMSEQELTEKIGVVLNLLYAAVILGTLLYQGGLLLYYSRATRKLLLEDTLTAESLPHSPIMPGGTGTPKSDRAP